jgi:hypothetical protein
MSIIVSGVLVQWQHPVQVVAGHLVEHLTINCRVKSGPMENCKLELVCAKLYAMTWERLLCLIT